MYLMSTAEVVGNHGAAPQAHVRFNFCACTEVGQPQHLLSPIACATEQVQPQGTGTGGTAASGQGQT